MTKIKKEREFLPRLGNKYKGDPNARGRRGEERRLWRTLPLSPLREKVFTQMTWEWGRLRKAN